MNYPGKILLWNKYMIPKKGKGITLAKFTAFYVAVSNDYHSGI